MAVLQWKTISIRLFGFAVFYCGDIQFLSLIRR